MKAENKRAREVESLLEALAHVSTEGVRVVILKNCFPSCVAGKVSLPECIFDRDMAECLRRTWRHELQHSRDFLDGVDLDCEAMEKRARQAEFLP